MQRQKTSPYLRKMKKMETLKINLTEDIDSFLIKGNSVMVLRSSISYCSFHTFGVIIYRLIVTYLIISFGDNFSCRSLGTINMSYPLSRNYLRNVCWWYPYISAQYKLQNDLGSGVIKFGFSKFMKKKGFACLIFLFDWGSFFSLINNVFVEVAKEIW